MEILKKKIEGVLLGETVEGQKDVFVILCNTLDTKARVIINEFNEQVDVFFDKFSFYLEEENLYLDVFKGKNTGRIININMY